MQISPLEAANKMQETLAKHNSDDHIAQQQCRAKTGLIYLSSSYSFSVLILTLIASCTSFDAANCLLVNVIESSRAYSSLSNQTATATTLASNDSWLNVSISSDGSRNNVQRSAKLQHEIDAISYLQRYGYMNGTQSNANLIAEHSFHDAIVNFQRFAGIPDTGVVDSLTVRLMQMPRCGNKDPSGKSDIGRRKRKRRKRYALQGSKWRRQELTYRISQYPTRFGHKKHEVDGQIEKAFKIWSQVAPIDFVVKKEGRVHIDIRFASGDHGDGDPFDGPGNTLAHAYFPQYGGDAHFDDQEYWTIDSYTGTNIFQVAAHELGHSLGLGHSNVRGALMAPFYQKYKPNFKLHLDDILAIQALYGEKPVGPSSADDDHPLAPYPSTTSTSTTTTPTTTTTTTTSTTTAAPTIDSTRSRYPIYTGFGRGSGEAASSRPPLSPFEPPLSPTTAPLPPDREANDNEGGNGLDPSSVNSIGRRSDTEPGVSNGLPADLCSDPKIDAITRTEDGNTFVFKGDYYWQLVSDGVAKGYPRRISADWDGLPGDLDAALTWVDGKTFFFKGNKYWRFRNRRRDIGYPKLISVGFAGIPDNIDAAFVWSGNGRTYIFKGSNYWRFDSKSDPPVGSEYPRSIKVWSGIPTNIDAAFKWENNVTYFFKDKLYYRFNDRDFKVEEKGRPPFPRGTASWWFGCVSSSLAQRAAMPSNLREGTTSRPQHSLAKDLFSSQQSDGEWSFLAGLETNTHELGTHINDQKPSASTPSSSKPIDEREEDEDDNKPEEWIPQGQQQPPLVYTDVDSRDMDLPASSRRSQSGFRITSLNPFLTSNSVPFQSSSSSSSSTSLRFNTGVHICLNTIWIQLQYACLSLISSYFLAIKQAKTSFKI